VSKNASEDDIRKAYRKLALVWHPDRHSGTEEATKKATQMFQDIGEAYSVLTDPKKRSDFDSGVDLMDMGGGGREWGEGVDVNNIFTTFFGGGDHFHGGGGGGGTMDWGNFFAHFGFGLPVMIYGHLIALDAYNALGRGRKLARWGEGGFLLVFGFLIFVLDIFGYKGCNPNGYMCKDINIMHMLFGIFMMAIGSVLLMHVYMRVFTHGSLWMTPVCLAVVGVFMTMHEQGSSYGVVVHTSFGIIAILAAFLRGLCLIDPQRWAILTAYASTITALCFVSGSDALEHILGVQAHLSGGTVVLGVVAVSTVLLVPFMFFLNWMNEGKTPKNNTSLSDSELSTLIGSKF